MADWQAIALAVVGVLSLSFQLAIKAMEVVAKRKQTMRPPPPLPAPLPPPPPRDAFPSNSDRPAMASDFPANFQRRFDRLEHLLEETHHMTKDASRGNR